MYNKIKNKLLIVFVLLLVGCGFIEDLEEKNIEFMKYLNPNRISKIEIFNQKKIVMIVEKDKKISEFVYSLKDLYKFHPNHPRYTKRWHVKIYLIGGEVETLIMMKEKNDQKNLYVHCLGPSWLGGGGSAISRRLYEWMFRNKVEDKGVKIGVKP